MKFLNKVFKEMKKKFDLVTAENAIVAKKNRQLETYCEGLSGHAGGFKARLIQGKQYSCSFNVDLKGIPVLNNEDLAKVVAEVGRAVEEPIEHAHI